MMTDRHKGGRLPFCLKNIPSLTLGHVQVERPLCAAVSPAQNIIYGVGGELGRAWLEHREAAGEGGGGIVGAGPCGYGGQ